MIKVTYIENAEPLDPKQAENIFYLLAERERVKYLSYRRWQDKQAYLLGKYLVLRSLNEYGNSAALIHNIQYTKFNRPYITEAGFDFNISHSGSLVICATSKDQVVGIDIERVQKVDLKDFTHILNKNDVSTINLSADKFKAFFRIWSAKEAVLKADGCGLTDQIDELELLPGTGLLMKKTYFLKDLNIADGYSSCIASPEPLTKITIEGVHLASSLHF